MAVETESFKYDITDNVVFVIAEPETLRKVIKLHTKKQLDKDVQKFIESDFIYMEPGNKYDKNIFRCNKLPAGMKILRLDTKHNGKHMCRVEYSV